MQRFQRKTKYLMEVLNGHQESGATSRELVTMLEAVTVCIVVWVCSIIPIMMAIDKIEYPDLLQLCVAEVQKAMTTYQLDNNTLQYEAVKCIVQGTCIMVRGGTLPSVVCKSSRLDSCQDSIPLITVHSEGKPINHSTNRGLTS
jgi:hypothetical protein